jgi:hypothetical protein
MKKIYYVVQKELTDVDGIEETTGWKNVCAYHIVDDELIKICDFDIEISDNTIPELRERLPEEFKEKYSEIQPVEI